MLIDVVMTNGEHASVCLRDCRQYAIEIVIFGQSPWKASLSVQFLFNIF